MPIFLGETLDDLGASKVMGSAQSRLCSAVPWQAQAKDLKPIDWFVQKKRLALCIKYSYYICMVMYT